jgi:hypothetical protein
MVGCAGCGRRRAKARRLLQEPRPAHGRTGRRRPQGGARPEKAPQPGSSRARTRAEGSFCPEPLRGLLAKLASMLAKTLPPRRPGSRQRGAGRSENRARQLTWSRRGERPSRRREARSAAGSHRKTATAPHEPSRRSASPARQARPRRAGRVIPRPTGPPGALTVAHESGKRARKPFGPDPSRRRRARNSVVYWAPGPVPGPTPRPVGVPRLDGPTALHLAVWTKPRSVTDAGSGDVRDGQPAKSRAGLRSKLPTPPQMSTVSRSAETSSFRR